MHAARHAVDMRRTSGRNAAAQEGRRRKKFRANVCVASVNVHTNRDAANITPRLILRTLCSNSLACSKSPKTVHATCKHAQSFLQDPHGGKYSSVTSMSHLPHDEMLPAHL